MKAQSVIRFIVFKALFEMVKIERIMKAFLTPAANTEKRLNKFKLKRYIVVQLAAYTRLHEAKEWKRIFSKKYSNK